MAIFRRGECHPPAGSGTVTPYIFVHNADATMARAIAGGATGIMPVDDIPYVDRQGGVRDPHGAIRWISQRLTGAAYY